MSETLARLEQTIAARRGADPETSYVARLHAKGVAKIAQKVGEEAVEAVIAAVKGDRAELVAESADVLFHLLVMLKARGVALDEVMGELESRTGRSGLAEKAGRGSK